MGGNPREEDVGPGKPVLIDPKVGLLRNNGMTSREAKLVHEASPRSKDYIST